MDIKRIENIFNLVKDNNIRELFWEKDDIRFRVKSNFSNSVSSMSFEKVEDTESNDNSNKSNQNIKKEELHLVTSKSVGIFKNRNIDKNSEGINLKIGDKINKYQVIGYIESMHIPKEIISDYDGIIKEIYVKNGDKVEYGQKLFSIE